MYTSNCIKQLGQILLKIIENYYYSLEVFLILESDNKHNF